MKINKQKENNGCLIACVSTILRKTYDETKNDFLDLGFELPVDINSLLKYLVINDQLPKRINFFGGFGFNPDNDYIIITTSLHSIGKLHSFLLKFIDGDFVILDPDEKGLGELKFLDFKDNKNINIVDAYEIIKCR